MSNLNGEAMELDTDLDLDLLDEIKADTGEILEIMRNMMAAFEQLMAKASSNPMLAQLLK